MNDFTKEELQEMLDILSDLIDKKQITQLGLMLHYKITKIIDKYIELITNE